MPDIDVKKIMKEIEEKVEEKRKKGIYTEDLDAIAMDVLRGTDMPDEVEYYMQKVNASWFLDDQTVTTIHGGLKGKLILFEKKIVKAIVRPWLCAVIDTQRDFNSLVVKALNAIVRKLDRLSVRLESKVSGLEQRIENVAKDAGLSGKEMYYGLQDPVLKSNTDRFCHYLKYFKGKADVIDASCRDTAFLKFLKENSISGYGLVPDGRIAKDFLKEGVKVKEGSILEHLFELPSDFLGGIFASGIAEILTPSEFRRFLYSSYDVLEPEAFLVVEIMNPNSVMVLKEFWKNGLRLRPIHPDYLASMMEECGFVDIEIKPLLPFEPSEMLSYVDGKDEYADILNENISKLNDILFGNRYYMVSGKK